VTDLDTVETERMVAERMRPRQQRELSVLLRDPRVARTLWPGEAPPSEGQLLHILAEKLDHWERYGFGLWLLGSPPSSRTSARVSRSASSSSRGSSPWRYPRTWRHAG